MLYNILSNRIEDRLPNFFIGNVTIWKTDTHEYRRVVSNGIITIYERELSEEEK